MVCAGLPQPAFDHAQRCFRMAVGMLEALTEENQHLPEKLRLRRIGITSGPVVAGIIGQNKFIYDLWGDTVNTASRMESSGVAGEIHITENTRNLWLRRQFMLTVGRFRSRDLVPCAHI